MAVAKPDARAETRSLRARRAGGVTPWVLGTALLAALLVAASGLLALWALAEPQARGRIEESLAAAHGLRLRTVEERQERLELAAELLASEELLGGPGAERDQEALSDLAIESRARLGLDLLAVLAADGAVRAVADGAAWAEGDPGLAASVAAMDGERPLRGTLVAPGGGRLYDVHLAPLVRDFEVVGYLLLGERIDEVLVASLRRATGAETVFLAAGGTGPAAVVSTLDEPVGRELVAALRARGDLLARAISRGEVANDPLLELDGRQWSALLAPLLGGDGKPVGAVVTLLPLDDRLGPLRQVALALLAGTVVALVLATLLALLARRRLGRPWRLLAAAAEAVRGGQLDERVPAFRGGVAARLATALDELRGELRERRELAHAVTVVGRRGIVAGGGAAARESAGEPPRSLPVVVVGFELRRFADPRGGYDPEASLAAFAADLERIETAVGTRGGRVVAVAGHRVTAVFSADGDGGGGGDEAAAGAALGAASEVLLALGRGASAFEEAEAPAIAIASGKAVVGTRRGDGVPLVTGLPIQQLESLLREATPGEVFLSRSVASRLEARFAAAGVTVRQQRPILGTQPLYALDAERARQITGVEPPPVSALAGPRAEPPVTGLAEVAPGTVLGQRFVVVGELEPVRGGRRLAAEDRELGDVVRLSLLDPDDSAAGEERASELRSRLRRLEEEPYPGLVRVLDYGRVDSLAFVSEQMPPGAPLSRLLERGVLPPVAALRVVRQVARALEVAHARGVVHGCLGPADVTVDEGGGVRLGGFVLPARASEAYCAPDRSPGADDPRDDLYSLGALAREVLTGDRPQAGDESPGVAAAVDVPERFAALVRRCLAPREERPRSLAEVLEELRHLHA